jgi:glycosyltransferase involved in cell wall biosynthesis
LPNVSVIIPTYNRAALVRKAVESVLEQTYADFEVIVADDGSIDNTREMLTGLSERVRYVPLAHGGRSRARNHALTLAKGRYIAFLDSDDLFFPYTPATQVDHLERNPEYGMVYGSAICFSETGEFLGAYEAEKSGWLYYDIALYLPLTITLPTVMLRKSVVEEIGGFDERMERFEDTDMWRRVSRRHKILAINKPLSKLLTHQGNRLREPINELNNIKYYVRKLMKEDRSFRDVCKRKLAANLFHHYMFAVYRDPQYRWTAIVRFAFWSIFYWPFRGRCYLYFFPKPLRGYQPVRRCLTACRRYFLVAYFPLHLLLVNPRDFAKRLKKRIAG